MHGIDTAPKPPEKITTLVPQLVYINYYGITVRYSGIVRVISISGHSHRVLKCGASF